jgi:predicted transcriptional regulator
MGRQRNPVVTARIEQVVKAWNKGDKTMWQIAAELGVAYGNAHSLLRVARERGVKVRVGERYVHVKPETTRLRKLVVNAFNRGQTQAQIGERFGITRGAVGRLIAEARAMGKRVISYTTAETSQRARAARRAKIGEAAFQDEMERSASLMRQARREKNQVAGPPPE